MNAELKWPAGVAGGMRVADCEVPDDRLYDLEHEVWWKAEPAGTARLGVMSTFGAFAGPLRELTFRPVTGTIARGRSVATVESIRFTGAVRVPVEAELVDRNPEVARRPRLLNDDPYGDGWVARLRPTAGTPGPSALAEIAAIGPRLQEMIVVRRIRCWPRTPEVELNEVGLECSAVLVRLDEGLARIAPGEALLLVTDDLTSPIEMTRWSDQTGQEILAQRREGGLYQFLVRRLLHPVPRRPRR